MSIRHWLFGDTVVDVMRAEITWLRKQNEELRAEFLRLADRSASADIEQRKWVVETGRHQMDLERTGKARPAVGAPEEAQAPMQPGDGVRWMGLDGGGHLEEAPTKEDMERAEATYVAEQQRQEATLARLRAEEAGQ
jgi:hypothetical protein